MAKLGVGDLAKPPADAKTDVVVPLGMRYAQASRRGAARGGQWVLHSYHPETVHAKAAITWCRSFGAAFTGAGNVTRIRWRRSASRCTRATLAVTATLAMSHMLTACRMGQMTSNGAAKGAANVTASDADSVVAGDEYQQLATAETASFDADVVGKAETSGQDLATDFGTIDAADPELQANGQQDTPAPKPKGDAGSACEGLVSQNGPLPDDGICYMASDCLPPAGFSATCIGGLCKFEALGCSNDEQCDDGDACTVDGCDAAGGAPTKCVHSCICADDCAADGSQVCEIVPKKCHNAACIKSMCGGCGRVWAVDCCYKDNHCSDLKPETADYCDFNASQCVHVLCWPKK